jgi:hypothetical protein
MTQNGLQWSTEQPRKPGWYWYKSRRDDAEFIEVVEVRPERYGPMMRQSSGMSFSKYYGFSTDEWAGPIEPPT